MCVLWPPWLVILGRSVGTCRQQCFPRLDAPWKVLGYFFFFLLLLLLSFLLLSLPLPLPFLLLLLLLSPSPSAPSSSPFSFSSLLLLLLPLPLPLRLLILLPAASDTYFQDQPQTLLSRLFNIIVELSKAAIQKLDALSNRPLILSSPQHPLCLGTSGSPELLTEPRKTFDYSHVIRAYLRARFRESKPAITRLDHTNTLTMLEGQVGFYSQRQFPSQLADSEKFLATTWNSSTGPRPSRTRRLS